MKRHTYSLLSGLLRLAKGAISACETWVRVEWDESRKPMDEESIIVKQKVEENEHASAGSSGRAY